jgi:predicted DNA-binding protein (UPF0251 family)
MQAVAPIAPLGTLVPTRVLAVGVDATVVPSLRRALPAGPLRLEMAEDFLTAVSTLLGKEWDVVVAGLGEDPEEDLRLWLRALEQVRGHPRFIAVMRQPARPAEAAASGVEDVSLAEVEAQHIRRVLEATGGRVMEAARILGVHRNTLARKMKAMKGRGR